MVKWMMVAIIGVMVAGMVLGEELIREKGKESPKPAVVEKAPVPAPLTHYMGREIAQTMHFTGAEWLTRESRQREEDGRTMLGALGIKEGMTVCDLGAGNGYYTLPLARIVGEKGKVLAVDIQPEMLEMLRKRAEKEGVKNIEMVLGTVVDPKLPEEVLGKVDLVLLVDTYHEFSNPVEMLAAIHKSLAPKGRLALVEFRAEDPEVPIKPLHKMSKEQMKKELGANGFVAVEEFDKLPWQHLMFFGKKEEPEGERREK